MPISVIAESDQATQKKTEETKNQLAFNPKG